MQMSKVTAHDITWWEGPVWSLVSLDEYHTQQPAQLEPTIQLTEINKDNTADGYSVWEDRPMHSDRLRWSRNAGVQALVKHRQEHKVSGLQRVLGESNPQTVQPAAASAPGWKGRIAVSHFTVSSSHAFSLHTPSRLCQACLVYIILHVLSNQRDVNLDGRCL